MNDDNKKKIMLMAGILVFLIGGFLVFYMLMGKKPTPDVANVVNTQPPLPSGKPFGQQNTNGMPAVVDINKNAAGRDLLTPPAAPPMISSSASAVNIADPFAGGPAPAPPPPPPPPPVIDDGGKIMPPLPPLPEYNMPIPAVPWVVTSGPRATPSQPAPATSNTGAATTPPDGNTPPPRPVEPAINPVSYRSVENRSPNMRLQGPDGVYTGWLVNNRGGLGLQVSLPAGNIVNLAAGDYICGLKIRSLTVYQMVLENEKSRQQLVVTMSYPANRAGTY